MEIVSPGSTDVVLRWASDAAGPITLLRRDLAPDQVPASVLPLDPVADAWRMGLSGGSVTLTDEAAIALPSGAREHYRVYQIIDAGGGCSNAGYVLARQTLRFPSSTTFGDLLSLPPRGSIRDARSLMEHVPQLRRVDRWLSEECRSLFLDRLADGSLSGVNFEFAADDGVRHSSAAGPITLVGAAASASSPLVVARSPLSGCNPIAEDVALPWGTSLRNADEILCGLESSWTDTNGDGNPDTCPAGIFEDRPSGMAAALQPDSVSGVFVARAVTRSPFGIRFSGVPFQISPSLAAFTSYGRADTADRLLDPLDLGAAPACRCADSDGDGEDDCTERLFGSDPSDPTSLGPDRDGDGVRDALDDCPADFDPAQADGDSDGAGDACDPCPADPADACVDPDGDGRGTGEDNCPQVPNTDQANADGDFAGNACDNCPNVANDQMDVDGDGIGNACDTCQFGTDRDLDTACDDSDNCPGVPNTNQLDTDIDGFGDACDCLPAGIPLPEVRILSVEFAIPGVRFVRRLEWQDERSPLGIDIVFDVVDGLIADLHRERGFGNTECLALGLDVPEFTETFQTGSRWYLVGMRSACRTPGWGHSTAGGGLDPRDRLNVAPPCP